MSKEKRFYHRQDGKWYVLRVKPRKGCNDFDTDASSPCGECSFFRPEKERNRCAAAGFASNTCCDCGKGVLGYWEEVGEHLFEDGIFGPYRLAKRLLALMAGIEFTHGIDLHTSSLKVANYCIRHRIPHRLIGHIKGYDTEAFFRALWQDGYFEIVVNGKYGQKGEDEP